MSLQVQRLEVLDPGRGPFLVRVSGRWEGDPPANHALIVETPDGRRQPVKPLPGGAESSGWSAGYAVDRELWAEAGRLAIWHPGGLAALALAAGTAAPAPEPEPAPAPGPEPSKLEEQLKQALAGAAKSLEASRERAKVAEARVGEHASRETAAQRELEAQRQASLEKEREALAERQPLEAEL